MDHAKEEYEYQHFHFSVRQFKEENRLFIKTTVGNVVGKLLAAILEKLGKNQSPESFEKIKKAIRNNILRESEDILKQFDDKITETFSIPNNALLPEDYLQKYKYTTEDEKNIQETYNELKNRYSHDVFLHTQLKNEILKFEQIEQCFDREQEISQHVKKGLLAYNQNYQEDFNKSEMCVTDKKPY